MKNLEKFFQPETTQEAIELLAKGEGRRQPLAGGTGLNITGSKNLEGLVDLTEVDLNYIDRAGDYLKIGATTTMNQLKNSDLIREFADGMITECVSHVGTTPLRNMITAGGNITQLRVWSDLPALLLTLDAEITVTDETGETTYAAAEFFEGHPSRLLDEADLVTEIKLPLELGDYRGAYTKFTKTEDGYATTTVSAAVKLNGEVAEAVRIGVGSASPSPTRCSEAEAKVTGEELTETAAAEAGEIARSNVQTTDNLWGSAEYKKILVEKLVKRTLVDAVNSS